MIKIPKISQENADKFYSEVHDLFLSFLKTYKYNDKYKKIVDYFLDDASGLFDENKIKNVLVGERKYLLDVINSVGSIKNDSEISTLYETFRNTIFSKKWPSLIGLRVCPYCNRTYITHEDDFDYDHFYCKSKYPYLGISMANLVPCCRTCNRDKGSIDTSIIPFTYPFEEEFGYEIVFDVKRNGDVFQQDTSYLKYFIDIKSRSNDVLPAYIKEEIKKLKYKEKYLSHESEIDNIFIQINERLPQRAESLKQTFGFSFNDKQSIWNYCDKNFWHRNILSKFTYDIVEQYLK